MFLKKHLYAAYSFFLKKKCLSPLMPEAPMDAVAHDGITTAP
jgi:hypothetical protein